MEKQLNNLSSDEQDGLEKEALRLLYASLPVTTLISVVLGFTLVMILSEQIPRTSLFVWFILLIAVSLLRFVAYYCFRYLQQEHSRYYLWGFRLGVLLSGLLWGWSGYIVIEQADVVYQIYISFILAGVVAGASSSLSADKYSVVIFIAAVLVPHITYYFLIGNETSIGMAIALIVFTAFMLFTARVHGINLFENYQLRLQAVESEKAVKHFAYHDSLTDLPNRLLFNDRLKQSLITAKRNSRILGVMFIDLDGFKGINDTYGHDAGDELLKMVAEKVRLALRQSDTLSRIGGDEFLVLLPEVVSTAAVIDVAKKIALIIDKPFQLDDVVLDISASIGVAIYPEHGKDGREILKNADIAMYRAKELGKNNVQLYTETYD